MPPDTQNFLPRVDPDVMVIEDDVPVPSTPVETAMDMMEVGNNVGHSSNKSTPRQGSIQSESSDQASTSAGPSTQQMLKFNIRYCDRNIRIELPENGTVSEYTNILLSCDSIFYYMFHWIRSKLNVGLK